MDIVNSRELRRSQDGGMSRAVETRFQIDSSLILCIVLE